MSLNTCWSGNGGWTAVHKPKQSEDCQVARENTK